MVSNPINDLKRGNRVANQECSAEDDILNWFAWVQAIKTIQVDQKNVPAAQMKLPQITTLFLQELEGLAMKQLSLSRQLLTKRGIRILGHKFDRNEYFVFFFYNGKTDMYRYSKETLALHIQKKVDSLSIFFSNEE